MEFSSRKVLEFLLEKDVTELHHANSVLTSSTFLSSGALLSRGTVEHLGLLQTSQYSDKADKKFSIWHDVFVDTCDIHNRANGRNKYGPVLFALDVKKLLNMRNGKIWISKLNPTKWQGKRHSDRWFTSLEEIRDELSPGTFDHMIIFRHCGGRIPLKPCLSKLVLDDPYIERTEEKVDFYSMAYGSLSLAMKLGGLSVPIQKRTCRRNCSCVEQYHSNIEKVDFWFGC